MIQIAVNTLIVERKHQLYLFMKTLLFFRQRQHLWNYETMSEWRNLPASHLTRERENIQVWLLWNWLLWLPLSEKYVNIFMWLRESIFPANYIFEFRSTVFAEHENVQVLCPHIQRQLFVKHIGLFGTVNIVLWWSLYLKLLNIVWCDVIHKRSPFSSPYNHLLKCHCLSLQNVQRWRSYQEIHPCRQHVFRLVKKHVGKFHDIFFQIALYIFLPQCRV